MEKQYAVCLKAVSLAPLDLKVDDENIVRMTVDEV